MSGDDCTERAQYMKTDISLLAISWLYKRDYPPPWDVYMYRARFCSKPESEPAILPSHD
jgi:hypothetical protein